MKTLYLLRHAKSDWGDPSLLDFDRPLNVRGRRAASTMGQFMVSHKIRPDLVICSSAKRTRETLDRMNTEMSAPIDAQFSDRLYEASSRILFDIIRGVDETHRSVMLIGHNPSLHTLAYMLVRSGVDDSVKAMQTKYPTGALAEIDLDIDLFRHIAPEVGHLRQFTRPKDLKG